MTKRLTGTTKPKAKTQLASTGFWLMKTEPETYSIDDFERDHTTLWTGVRNYLARNFMMSVMQPGDQILFYHSNAQPSAVVGVGEVVRTNVPDPTALDTKSEYYDPKASSDHPIWFCAEVKFKARLQAVALSEIRACTELSTMALVQKGQRLSVLPVNRAEFQLIVKMGKS